MSLCEYASFSRRSLQILGTVVGATLARCAFSWSLADPSLSPFLPVSLLTTPTPLIFCTGRMGRVESDVAAAPAKRRRLDPMADYERIKRELPFPLLVELLMIRSVPAQVSTSICPLSCCAPTLFLYTPVREIALPLDATFLSQHGKSSGHDATSGFRTTTVRRWSGRCSAYGCTLECPAVCFNGALQVCCNVFIRDGRNICCGCA